MFMFNTVEGFNDVVVYLISAHDRNITQLFVSGERTLYTVDRDL